MGEYDPFDDNADQSKKGWLTAILELGAWVGALFSSFIAEYLSRKFGIIIATGVFIFGVCIQTIAITGAGPNATLAGRFITGMGVGSVSMIVPIVSIISQAPLPSPVLTDPTCSTLRKSLLRKSVVLWWLHSSWPSPLAS